MSLLTPPFKERETPTSFNEPFSGKLYDREFGAMPANPFKSDAVKKRQAGVETEFYKLFTPPEDLNIPPDFADFLLEDYEMGERIRHLTNYNNYMAWLKENGTLPLRLRKAQLRIEDGRAEVEDVFKVALARPNTHGFEVGRVTNPYWQRMGHVATMREFVANAVVARGGRLEPQVLPYRSIDIKPKMVTDENGTRRLIGFLAMYKHDIAHFGEDDDEMMTNVVERQIAGIRVDPDSGFREDIVDRMKHIALHETGFDWSYTSHPEFEHHLRTSGARGFIEKAIQTDSTEEFIVPESTTVYIFDEPTDSARSLAKAAFRLPDKDNGIAYYNSSKS